MTDESSVNPQEDGSKTAARRTVHEWLEDALGRFQVTHCHSSIKEALKEMERTDVDLANELAASPVVQSRESTLPELEPLCDDMRLSIEELTRHLKVQIADIVAVRYLVANNILCAIEERERQLRALLKPSNPAPTSESNGGNK